MSEKEIKPRKKRRVPGTETPPRASFVVRIEVTALTAVTELLQHYNGSRNDYVCALINADLEHRKRFIALNTDIPKNLDLLNDGPPKAERKPKGNA